MGLVLVVVDGGVWLRPLVLDYLGHGCGKDVLLVLGGCIGIRGYSPQALVG